MTLRELRLQQTVGCLLMINTCSASESEWKLYHQREIPLSQQIWTPWRWVLKGKAGPGRIYRVLD